MPVTPSPLRYPGGKACYTGMLKWIIDNNDLYGCDYVEPYAGGAGAAIGLLLDGYVGRLFLNDYDPAVYSFWKAILMQPERFIQKINETEISVAEWFKQKEIYVRCNSYYYFNLGFSTFYLNRCNRAGILWANPIGGLTQNGKYKIDARFKKDKLVEKIKRIVDLKERIKIFNLDAIEFLAKIERPNETMVYFDPPYYDKGELLYLNHYEHEDHEDLFQAIASVKAKWLLSYDCSEEITKLYKNYKIYKKKLRYTISSSTIAEELLITSLAMPSDILTYAG